MPNVQTKTEITLALTAQEALWLKITIQNPVGPEGSKDYNIRKGLFDALPEIPELEVLRG